MRDPPPARHPQNQNRTVPADLCVGRFDVGPSLLSSAYGLLDKFKLTDFSRHDLDAGLLVGYEQGGIIAYGGLRYIFSSIDFQWKTENIPTESGVEKLGFDDPMHQVGGVVGVMLGYGFIFVNLEMSILHVFYAPTVLASPLDLDGWSITPTLGLSLRF